MKKHYFLALLMLPLLLTDCKVDNASASSVRSAEGTGTVQQLTDESFKKLIFNYDKNTDWKYEGTKPAIIDFYADWCAPCRQLSPLVEEVAKEYSGKINVYKVDTQKEAVLAQNMGITSLPTLLFIPENGKPQFTIGLIPKETLVKAVNEILINK